MQRTRLSGSDTDRAMPILVFERTGLRLDVPDGGRLIDLCDQYPRAGIPFSCRHANCGTCRVEVSGDVALCEPPAPAEQRLLDILGHRPGHRLGCQLVIRPGHGTVRLRVTL